MSGDQTFSLHEPTATGQVPALRITVLSGPDEGRSVVVDKPDVVIGRGETADVRLTDPAVSHSHVELSPRGQGVVFRDKRSRNGVLVAGVRAESGIAPSGCVFTLGMTALRVELGGEYAVPRLEVSKFGKLVGASPSMRELYAKLERLAARDISVLLEGETGTGKELAARALHDASPRRKAPFVTVDCTTLQKELAASKLFGHERGAFTGATEQRIGAFEEADGGTLFLDEVGELPLDLQPMLLRVLEQREVIPVGSHRPRPVDVRVISATWRDLHGMLNRGAFRPDLYYRLVQERVTMPSLIQRKEDIPTLAYHFLAKIPAERRAARAIADDVMTELCARPWPGNIRELKLIVERLAFLATGSTVTLVDLFGERALAAAYKRDTNEDEPLPDSASAAPGRPAPFKAAKRAAIDAFESEYATRLLQYTGNNLSLAARIAQMERHSFRELLKRQRAYDGGSRKKS